MSQTQIKTDTITNALWIFFERNEDGITATCNSCNKKLSCRTSISSLKYHLQKKHESNYDHYLNILKSIGITEDESINEDEPVYEIYITKDEVMQEETVEQEIEEEVIEQEDSSSYEIEETSQKFNIADYIQLPSNSLNNGNSNFFGKLPKKVKLEKKNDIDLALLKMITNDFHPISIVNNTSFRELVHALNPTYEIPDENKLSSKLLPRVYENRLQQVKSQLYDNVKSVSVSMECWTSISNDNYMAITVHFISEDTIEPKSVLIQCAQINNYNDDVEVYNEIKRILQEWDLYDKVNFFVSNNNSVLEGTTKYLEWDGWIVFGCLAFKLNHIVQETLKEIKDTIKKVQLIVDCLRKMPTGNENLLNYQITNQNSLAPKTVINCDPRRWNSIYLMLERFVELKQALQDTIPNLNMDTSNIDFQEWKLIEQICVILKPFYEAINEMYAENYLVASKAFVLIANLTNICDNYMKLKDLCSPAMQFAQKLKERLQSQLEELESNIPICISTVLDPRFKIKPIKSKDNVETVKTKIIGKMIDEINNGSQNSKFDGPMSSVNINQNTSDGDLSSLSLWNEFDNDTCIAPESPKVKATGELNKYLAEPLIKRTECPYTWWRDWKCIYPTLYELFKLNCNIMVTSIPCDRIFSNTQDRISDRRACMTTSNISELMFLNANKFGETI